MVKHKVEGKNFYLRLTEPVKFATTLVNNIQKIEKKGFKVTIFLGGPEQFPSHIFHETELYSKKFLLFIYGISYWTHIAFDVKGGADEENKKEIDKILSGIENEVSPF